MCCVLRVQIKLLYVLILFSANGKRGNWYSMQIYGGDDALLHIDKLFLDAGWRYEQYTTDNFSMLAVFEMLHM